MVINVKCLQSGSLTRLTTDGDHIFYQLVYELYEQGETKYKACHQSEKSTKVISSK